MWSGWARGLFGGSLGSSEAEYLILGHYESAINKLQY